MYLPCPSQILHPQPVVLPMAILAMATLTRCRKSCFLNPLYDLLPRNSWLVQHGTCQARSDFLLDEATGTLPMWKPAALRLWPIRPSARPASSRSSSGRSRASASLCPLADVVWLAGHTGVVSPHRYALLPLTGQLLPQHGASLPGAVHHRGQHYHLHFERRALPGAAAAPAQ